MRVRSVSMRRRIGSRPKTRVQVSTNKNGHSEEWPYLVEVLVGMAGFEPTTP